MAESNWRVRGTYLGHQPVRSKGGDEYPDFYELALLTGQSITRVNFNTRTKQGEVTEIGRQLEALRLTEGERVVLGIGKPHAKLSKRDGAEPKAFLSITAYDIAREPAAPVASKASSNGVRATAGASS